MKIVLIYRSKKNNAHSIENVFDTVHNYLDSNVKDLELIKYYAEGSLLKTVKDLRSIKNVDIYHITGVLHYLCFFLPRKKTTVTIHDIGIFKDHPRTLRKYVIALISFILPCLYLNKIIVISELVKFDLIKYFRIAKQKILVINNPLSIKPTLVNMEKERLSRINILQIGSSPNKNLLGLINAIKEIKENYKITIIGCPDEKLIKMMDENLINYSINFNVTDNEIRQAYINCNIVYFASTSEGFGLPILEGQFFKRPVITSNLSPMKEIGGDGVVLVNPLDSDSIRLAILKISNDVVYRDLIIDNGLINIKKFSPEIISIQYLNFFKSIASKK